MGIIAQRTVDGRLVINKQLINVTTHRSQELTIAKAAVCGEQDIKKMASLNANISDARTTPLSKDGYGKMDCNLTGLLQSICYPFLYSNIWSLGTLIVGS